MTHVEIQEEKTKK